MNTINYPKPISASKFKLLWLFLLFVNFYLPSKAQRPIRLDELNPERFNPDMSSYHQATALYCANLAALAYAKNDADIQQVCDAVNAANPKTLVAFKTLSIKSNRTKVLIWGTSRFIIVAFRGTVPTRFLNWVTNGKVRNESNTANIDSRLSALPSGHRGFRKAVMNFVTDGGLLDSIKMLATTLNQSAIQTIPVYLTGHSLGAAISQMFMPVAATLFDVRGAYNFAPPLAARCTDALKLRRLFGCTVYDIVNENDFVPRAGRFGTSHFGKFYRLHADSLTQEAETWKHFAGSEVVREFQYHSMDNHLIRLRDPQNADSLVLSRSIKFEPCQHPDSLVTSCKAINLQNDL
jgi:hypothetical protein